MDNTGGNKILAIILAVMIGMLMPWTWSEVNAATELQEHKSGSIPTPAGTMTWAEFEQTYYYAYSIGVEYDYFMFIEKADIQAYKANNPSYTTRWVDTGTGIAFVRTEGDDTYVYAKWPLGTNQYHSLQYNHDSYFSSVNEHAESELKFKNGVNMSTVQHNIDETIYKEDDFSIEYPAYQAPIDYDNAVVFSLSENYFDLELNWTDATGDVDAIQVDVYKGTSMNENIATLLGQYAVDPALMNSWVYDMSFNEYSLDTIYTFYAQAFVGGEVVKSQAFYSVSMQGANMYEAFQDVYKVNMEYINEGLKISALQNCDLNYVVYHMAPNGGYIIGSQDVYSSSSTGIQSYQLGESFILSWDDIVPSAYAYNLKVYARDYQATGESMQLIFDGSVDTAGKIEDTHEYGQPVETEQYYNMTDISDINSIDWTRITQDFNQLREFSDGGLKFIGSSFEILPYPFNMGAILLGFLVLLSLTLKWVLGRG